MSNDTIEERRQNTKLREVFDAVYASIVPFFDPANNWGGHSLEHLAYRVVRENYPNLSRDEVHQLIVAATRAYQNRSLG